MNEPKDNIAGNVANLLSEAYRRRFANSRYAPGRTDYYGFEVIPKSDDGCIYDLIITFKKGEQYCCLESACHFGFWRAEDWSRLRNEFPDLGLQELDPLHIETVRVIVEEGVLHGLGYVHDSSQLIESGQQSYELGPFDESNPVKPVIDNK